MINIILFACICSNYLKPTPWTTAKKVAAAITEIENEYVLSEELSTELLVDNAWAIYIDNNTFSVLCNTENLPDTTPLNFTASEVSNISRGYMGKYSTFVAEAKNGLIVLGYPENSYFTHTTPTWDYEFISNLPYTILIFIGINTAIIFLIYMLVSGRLLKSFKPIIDNISKLPTGETSYAPEKGFVSEIAKSINDTSDVIRTQKTQLRKKETARANWIAGVSHDIRTPLSLIMVYASRISKNDAATNDIKNQAKNNSKEHFRYLFNDVFMDIVIDRMVVLLY